MERRTGAGTTGPAGVPRRARVVAVRQSTRSAALEAGGIPVDSVTSSAYAGQARRPGTTRPASQTDRLKCTR